MMLPLLSAASQPIEAVIFDRDGVISFFDEQKAMRFLGALLPISLNELAAHWNALGQRQGWPRTLEEEVAFFRVFWQHLGTHCQLPATTVQTLIAWDYKAILQPFADALPVLSQLKERGFKIGVLSNFSLASLEPSLEYMGLITYVDVACAATVIGVAKPGPDAYRIIADRLGVAAQACLFIDDEAEHVAGAQAVGMQARLLVRDGSKARQDEALPRIATLFDILHPDWLVQQQPR